MSTLCLTVERFFRLVNSLIDIAFRLLVLFRGFDDIAIQLAECASQLPGTISAMVVRTLSQWHRAVGDSFLLVEPVASTKPKFPMTENSRTYTTYTVRRELPLTLPCPAQAFPVPVFRYA